MEKNEIHVMYGTDSRKMTYEMLENIQLIKDLNAKMHIGIKPNLVVAKPANEGATTSPLIVEGVIQYLQNHGCMNISIMEGSWVGDNTKRAFKVCGYEDLARKYNVPLYDLKEDSSVIRKVGDLELNVCQKPLQVDFLINIPVLKAHCQTLMTCALKNLKGCIPDKEKRRFHALGLTKPIGYLAKAIPMGLIIVDGMAGDLTFEEGGNPVQMDRILLGKDPVLMDTYAASLLGYTKEEIEYIEVAESMGVGSGNLSAAKIQEYNVGLKKSSAVKPSNKVRYLTKKVIAESACSACYGSLVHALQRLDDKDMLKKIKQTIYIGQDFQGKELQGIGIGRCTNKCTRYVVGCPPTAADIIKVLESV
ncbi:MULTISPECIES: DUF362 domain-containing protein [Pelosinus]|uniref:DUF362 domain-containing protein n=1 Tax=Pelosinus fermentans B4 TaxID=1149862 RepID=I9LIX0_9FIRM|nr:MULTISPECIES: DUF362 domain-containing protein [Pelosinus]EIW20489.1 protein of unknown function DUF362 [Pelosinus fermentans B4]EIW25796.1 protein of unknown function DUF362 [Pelosinus fermentans A11]OAM93520.1 protein of unknown function DUF362 [Pelosinus fermentans DSM 17108]SDQ80671.1 Uncharacterized conserved protein, DUF362 family [Pelosinus fermentans]